MPARKYRKNIILTKRIKPLKIVIFSIILITTFSFILHVTLSSKQFEFSGKVNIASVDKEGNSIISIYDTLNNEIILIKIPSNLQINVSRNLGIWKIKSLWALGQQAKVDGVILTETLTRKLGLPVYFYGSENISGFSSTGLSPKVKALLFPGSTNLGFGDRLRLLIFSLKIRNRDKIDINLSDYSFLKETKLTDGSIGYILVGDTPTRITSFFNEPVISNSNIIVEIIDKTNAGNMTKSISRVIETLGGKVVSVSDKPAEKEDCFIRSGIPAVKLIANYLNCIPVIDNNIESGKVQIEIGTDYQERY